MHLVRDKRRRSFSLLAWLLALSNLIFVVYVSLATDQFSGLRWIIFPIALYFVFLVTYEKVTKRSFMNQFSLLPGFLLLAIAWFLLRFPLMGIASLLICMSAYFAFTEKSILVTEQAIRPRILFGQNIAWNLLNNVVLKDNVLTIDYKNNKLFQQEIDETISRVNEKEFNDFCKEQLRK